jgi:hypothetical protein
VVGGTIAVVSPELPDATIPGSGWLDMMAATMAPTISTRMASCFMNVPLRCLENPL